MKVTPRFQKQRSLWHAVIWSTTYIIWGVRNSVIYNGKKADQVDLCLEVQVLTFFWFMHRAKKFMASWHEWCTTPQEFW